MLTRVGGHYRFAIRRTPRSFGILAAIFGGVLTCVGFASAQETKIEQRVLQSDDEWQIYITYLPSMVPEKDPSAKETPVVVLLHGDKENRLVWEGMKGLAPHLQAQGYAVIAVDLRKHGQSTNVTRAAGDSPSGGRSGDGANLQGGDYESMVAEDMEAVKKFIYEQNQAKRLNMNKMAIIAAESSAAVALAFAVNDWQKEPFDDAPSDDAKTPRGQDVRALVLLSPVQRVRGLPLGEVLSDVRDPDWNIAILTMYGKLNKTDARDAASIHKKLAGNAKVNEDRIYLKGFNFNLRGTALLGKREVDAEPLIDAFLQKHLKMLAGSDWRNRQSRLTSK